MIDTVTLLDFAVGLLTRPSLHRVIDPITGESSWVTADPLLIQLVIAIRNTTAGTAFKSGAVHPPLPFSGEAVDLLARIEQEAAEHFWALHRLHFGEGRGTLGGRIRAWAMAARADAGLTAEAERIMSGWVRDIRALLDPPRIVEIAGRCPECGMERVLRIDDDGGTVTTGVLLIRYIDGYPARAECRNCGMEWEGFAMVETWGQEVISNDTAAGTDVPKVREGDAGAL